MFALVDEEDYHRLIHWKWMAKGNKRDPESFYAVRKIHNEGKRNWIYMHKEVMGAGKGQPVDHVDRSTLDNRRSNLRFINRQPKCSQRKAQKAKHLRF